MKACEDGLRDLRWVPGRNLVIEYRFADGKLERLPQLAQDLVRLKVNAIVMGYNSERHRGKAGRHDDPDRHDEVDRPGWGSASSC